MSTAHAVATKNTKNDAAASRNPKNTQVAHEILPEAQTEFPEQQFLLQRKENACPCGGSCPKCLGALGIQAKLKIGAPNDKYEQEADRVADQVMRMPEPAVQRQPEEEEEEETIQMKSTPGNTPTVGATTHANIQSLKGGGQPLSSNQRTFFESRMGHDFSGVRIHTDTRAADTAQSVQAKAFTLGNNIVFNTNQYSPNNQEGKKLLAHELTHVVQQNVGQKRTPTSVFSLNILSSNAPNVQFDKIDKSSTNSLAVQWVNEALSRPEFVNRLTHTHWSSREELRQFLRSYFIQYSLAWADTIPEPEELEMWVSEYENLAKIQERNVRRTREIPAPSDLALRQAKPIATEELIKNIKELEERRKAYEIEEKRKMDELDDSINNAPYWIYKGRSGDESSLQILQKTYRHSVVMEIEFSAYSRYVGGELQEAKNIANFMNTNTFRLWYIEGRRGIMNAPKSDLERHWSLLYFRNTYEGSEKWALITQAFLSHFASEGGLSGGGGGRGRSGSRGGRGRSGSRGTTKTPSPRVPSSQKPISAKKTPSTKTPKQPKPARAKKSARRPKFSRNVRQRRKARRKEQRRKLKVSDPIKTKARAKAKQARAKAKTKPPTVEQKALPKAPRGNWRQRLALRFLLGIGSGTRKGIGAKSFEGYGGTPRSGITEVAPGSGSSTAPAPAAGIKSARGAAAAPKPTASQAPRTVKPSSTGAQVRAPESATAGTSATATQGGGGLGSVPTPAIPPTRTTAGTRKTAKERIRDEIRKKLVEIQNKKLKTQAELDGIQKKISESSQKIRKLKEQVEKSPRGSDARAQAVEKLKAAKAEQAELIEQYKFVENKKMETIERKNALIESLKLDRPPLSETTKKAVRDAAEDAGLKTADGKFIDPNTNRVIEGKFHYGHKYGLEHRRLALEAAKKGMTQQQFNDWVNSHPEWFQIESPESNLSGSFEKPGID